jgi:hypothetical protein
MNVICILNDSNNNYIINNNEISYKSQIINKNLSCKFTKLINRQKMSTTYYSQIIDDLKDNSLKVPTNKTSKTIFLIGDHEKHFSDLVRKIIEEFIFETVGFNFYIHEIKYNGVYDMILNKFIDVNLEKSNGFLKTKIFLDGFDKDINNKKNQIIDSIESNIKRKKNLTYMITTFENLCNKITIYNLSDIENIIDTERTDIVNYRNYFGLIDYNFIKSKLLDVKIDKNKISNESYLMNYFLNDITGDYKVIYNLTKISPKTWELVSMFYDYGIFHLKNQMALVPFNKLPIKPIDVPKSYSLNNGFISKYSKSNNVLKPFEKSGNNYKILEKPSFSDLNNLNGGLVNYSNKHKTFSPKSKNKPKQYKKQNGYYPDEKSAGIKTYQDKNVDKLVYELIKYIQKPQDPILTFDKLMIFNKFLFNHTVKNHLKLQKANKEPEKLKVVNDEIISEMRAMLTVMLDQYNDL